MSEQILLTPVSSGKHISPIIIQTDLLNVRTLPRTNYLS